MNFEEIIVRAVEILGSEGRVAHDLLKRRLDLDDRRFATLKRELIQLRGLAVEEGFEFLVCKKRAREERKEYASRASLTAAGERRRLTVMFCDLVESTRLAAQIDPEDFASIIHQYRDLCSRIVTRLDGYVAQYLGDGVLIYFGYPEAHEDDAQRATRAGLEFIAALQAHNRATFGPQLRTRVGIHTGLAVTRDMSALERHDTAIVLGETPNLAARVHQAAEPDTVVISAATHRLVQGFFACENLGPRIFKGTSNPVEIYRVLGESTAESRFEARSGPRLRGFVNRAVECKTIEKHWQLAVAGKGQVLVVTGDPGIGKSRLVHEVKRLTKNVGSRVELHCSPFHTTSALYPVIRSLHRIFGLRECPSTEEKLSRLRAVLSTHTFTQGLETASLFAALLSLSQDVQPATLTPQMQKERTLVALIAWLLEAANAGPVCVAVEDLQWADPSTRELLALCLQQSSQLPILWILTCRPGGEPLLATEWPVTQLRLKQLDADCCRRVIEQMTGGKRLPSKVTGDILDKAGGNPLFLEELTQNVLESGSMKLVDDHYEIVDPSSESALLIPATLHDSLTARLDNLKEHKEIAQLCAILGREFAYDLLQAVSNLDAKQLQIGLERLVDSQLLNRSDRWFEFKHALIQEAAYESILKSKRQQHHSRIAEILVQRFPDIVQSQPEFVAYHYEKGSRLPEAITFYRIAAEKAAEKSANHEAITYLRRALDLLRDTPASTQRDQTELMLQVELGAPQMAIKGFASQEAEKAYQRAHELCKQLGDDIPQLFRSLWGLWLFNMTRARHVIGHEMAERCRSIAVASGDTTLTREAHHALGVTLLAMGEFGEALRHFLRALALSEQTTHTSLEHGHDCGVACSIHAALAAWCLGYANQARQLAAHALALVKQHSHPFSSAIAADQAALLAQVLGNDRAVREHAESAIAVSTDMQFSFWMYMGVILRGWALSRQGALDEGLRQMSRGLADFEATGAEQMRSYFLWLQAEACHSSGKPEEGLDFLTKAQVHLENTNERWWEAEIWRLRGELLLQQHGTCRLSPSVVATVKDCLHKSLYVARRQNARAFELRTAMSLVRLSRWVNDEGEARTALAQTYATFEEGLDTPDLQEARALLACLGSPAPLIVQCGKK